VLVDLRSDTVTRPTEQMRRAMAEAEVGDDEYGEDPTVNRLQEAYADITGKEASIYVPSGTMANQIALRCLTRPGDAVITGRRQHVVLYEEGAGPVNAGVTFLVVDDESGALDPEAVDLAVESGRHHQPQARLVAVEDTHMASAATTVMSCLSKGLGAPVGSLIAGPADLIEEAKLHRKRLGGTMRQSGVIAAAGLVALGRVERLAEDHERARRLAEAVVDRWPGIGFDPSTVETNIVAFSPPEPESLLEHLASGGVAGGTVAPGRVRLVTHADVDDAGVERACSLIAKAP
jgi:threonine aldolase